MPPPTVLKHCLKGKNMLPLVRGVREGQMPPQLVRFRMNVSMETMEDQEIIDQFRELTGENEKEMIEMAGKEVESLRLLAHYAVILANECGQPEGQELHREERVR